MIKDPIVEEVRHYRQEHAAKYSTYDTGDGCKRTIFGIGAAFY